MVCLKEESNRILASLSLRRTRTEDHARLAELQYTNWRTAGQIHGKQVVSRNNREKSCLKKTRWKTMKKP